MRKIFYKNSSKIIFCEFREIKITIELIIYELLLNFNKNYLYIQEDGKLS